MKFDFVAGLHYETVTVHIFGSRQVYDLSEDVKLQFVIKLMIYLV